MTRPFWLVLSSAALFFFGFGTMNALIPTFVVDELDGTEATAGFVMGSFAITALVSRVWWGRLSDRRGARPIMMVGAAFGAIAFVVMALVPTMLGTVTARLLFGAGVAALVTASTSMALHLAPDHRRGQASSLVLVSFHAGLGFGPVVAERLQEAFDYRGVWLASAVCSLAAGMVASALPHRPGDPDAAPSPLIQRRALAPGVVTVFGVAGFNGFLVFAPLYAREVGLDDAGVVFLTASITLVAVRLLLGGVPDRIGPVRASTIAIVVSIGAAVLVAYWATPVGLVVGAALLALGLSLQSPSLIPLAVEGVPDAERGAAMATYTSFFDVANSLYGPVLGLVVVSFGYRPAFLVAAACGVVALAVLHLVVVPARPDDDPGLSRTAPG